MMTPKSGALLGGSCVAAIAAVGCVFELAYGTPRFGNLGTGVILALTVPLTVLLFFAAVRDARANQ
jgi:preprotein translocase subunit SecY